jgi:hypothetical protein
MYRGRRARRSGLFEIAKADGRLIMTGIAKFAQFSKK